jgi:hypothetical protein
MSATNPMNAGKSRGTVIKVPDATPGIVFANGQQHHFTLDGVWKSPVAPAANQTVDVEFDAAGGVAGIAVVDPHQANKEMLNHLGEVAQERGKEAAKLAEQGVGALAARMGIPALIVAVVLWVAWFFFPAASIGGLITFSFWSLLGFDFSSTDTTTSGNHGLWSIIGVAAILAPFAAPFIRKSWSRYLNAAPLAYILIASLMIYINESKTFGSFGDANAFSFSWGIFALVAVAAIMAAGALKKPTNP